MVINEWTGPLSQCQVVHMAVGTRLYHSARRLPGDHIAQEQMFLTPSESYAWEYYDRDPRDDVERTMVAFELTRDVVLLDISALDLDTLNHLAVEKNGYHPNGAGDCHIRYNMIDTVRHVFGDHVDGTISTNDRVEVHLDSRMDQLSKALYFSYREARALPTADFEITLQLLHDAFCHLRWLAGRPVAAREQQRLYEVADAAHNLPLALTGDRKYRAAMAAQRRTLESCLASPVHPDVPSLRQPVDGPRKRHFSSVAMLAVSGLSVAVGILVGRIL